MSSRSETDSPSNSSRCFDGADFKEVTQDTVSKATLKQIASLGHVISRFLEARRVVFKQAQKQSEGQPTLAQWLGINSKEGRPVPPLLEGDGYFATALRSTGKQLQADTLLLSSTQVESLLKKAGLTGVALTLPVDANAAIWPALLRLGILKSSWEQEMRKNLYDALNLVLPDAWVLDPTPMPPGTVIPRLELAAWQDLDQTEHESLSFTVTSAWNEATTFGPINNDLLQQALRDYPATVSVLTARTQLDDNALVLVAIYEKKSGRTEMVKCLHIL